MAVEVVDRPALTRKDLQKRLRVRRAAINELVASGRIRSVRIGNAIRISEEALRNYLLAEAQGAEVAQGREPVRGRNK